MQPQPSVGDQTRRSFTYQLSVKKAFGSRGRSAAGEVEGEQRGVLPVDLCAGDVDDTSGALVAARILAASGTKTAATRLDDVPPSGGE
jgi:hypothetical protein